jgi:hypothetical protein
MRPTDTTDRTDGLRPRWIAASLVAAAAGGYAWGLWQPPAPAHAAPEVPTVAGPRADAGTLPSARIDDLPPAPPPGPAWAEAPATPVLAQFGRQKPSASVRQLADWSLTTGDAQGHALVLVDKRAARVWVLDPAGKLLGQTPALMGAAVGDDATPGIGDKPLAQVLPHEKTTPAGRYLAEIGENANGEDVVWVSWDLAVSLHRVRPHVDPSERRAQRLASRTADDNRISFGCINLPPAFYEGVLKPAVQRHGAVVYVLPETRSLHAQFGAWDVRAAALLAGWDPGSASTTTVTAAAPAAGAHGRVK